MVKSILVSVVMASLSLSVNAQDTSNITANELEKLLKSGAKSKQSAADRFKASRMNTKNLTVIKETTLTYLLPNGEFVLGMLLPNNKISPAIKTKTAVFPACVTKSYKLVKGEWNNKRQIIKCELKASELALIPDLQVKQIGIPTANKYALNDSGTAPHISTRTGDEAVELPNGKTRSANKYNNGTTVQQAQAENTYTPPPRNSTRVNTVGGALKIEKNKYGISMGTWMKAELLRTVSSAESGQIELRLTESVSGRIKILPSETLLFAQKNFNSGSLRLEGITTTAILPNGEEIQMSARIYSTDKTAGLSGSITRDREGEMIAAGTNTIIKTATKTLAATSTTGQVASGFAGELLDNEQKNAPQTPTAIIEVVRQHVWLKLSKSI